LFFQDCILPDKEFRFDPGYQVRTRTEEQKRQQPEG